MSRRTVTETRVKTCEQCGSQFSKDARYSQRYWARQRFCSSKCSGEHHSATRVARDIRQVFFAAIRKSESGCWEWMAAKDRDGYGMFSFEYKHHRAHRLSLKLAGVDVPKGAFVCHHCDNPSCVNPAHLYVGTPRQNVSDKLKRGRQARGAQMHSAKLTDTQVLEIRQSPERVDVLAQRYGISRSNVDMIRARRTWTHLP